MDGDKGGKVGREAEREREREREMINKYSHCMSSLLRRVVAEVGVAVLWR